MPLNFGKQINTIPGITGVASGGQAQVQINPNRRISRLNFQCTGVAYVAPVLTLPASAGATVQPTFNVTLTAGKITSVTINSGTATTAANGTYTLVVTDNITVVGQAGSYNNNSYGAVITAVVATAVVTSVTLVNGGNVAAVPIELFFSGQILQSVGGVNMRDINATLIKASAYLDDTSTSWQLGQLTLNYIRPSDRFTNTPDVTIWDLWGQSVLQLQLPITSNITSPGLVGVYEFDQDASLRNIAIIGGQSVPVLQPIAQHAQSFAVPAGSSLFSINTVPFLINPQTPLPILRLLMQEQTPGNITQIEIDQDGNKIVQLTQAQIQQMYADYRFNTANGLNIFGGSFISDIDRRIAKALRCQTSLVIWISSAVTQQITILRETLPGAYSGG
jgi:hypothetical protein